MTPERKKPGLRFDKGGEAKPAKPKAKGRPAGAWKKAAARMVPESAVQPEKAPAREGAVLYTPDAPEASPVGESPRPAGADTEPEAPSADGEPRQAEDGAAPDGRPAGLGQSVPKYRQRGKAGPALGQSVHKGKFRQDSQQAHPSDRLHHDEGGGSGPAGPAAGGPGAGGGDPPEPEKLRKARQRMEHFDGKRGAAREKLAKQKPPKKPGPVKYAAGYAGRSVHGFVHGKIYQVEHENVGTEGAHRSELVGEAAGRRALRFARNRLKTRPARQVKKAEGRYIKAAADFRFQQAAAENPDLGKNALARMWRKRQQRKRYQKQAREAAKQGARAAEKTAVTAEKAGRAVVGLVKRHPVGVLIALLCLLLLVGMQSCMSSLAAIGNGMAGSVAATTYPAEDADLLGAEAAYAGLEAELQTYLDTYEATHNYDEYHFDLDSIEHDPYVLLSILSALHAEGWTLADVQGNLQALFDHQYILTESVTVEVRYRTETRTAEDGSTYTVQVPYNYYICTVTLENFDLSHVPVYVMGEEQLSRYALYMAALGNRPDLFPGSAYIGRYDGPVTRYEIPPEALEDEQFAAMIAEAEKYLGYPYIWGGSSPATSFDCSGFVSWVVNHCGMGWNFGRLGAQGLYNVCTPVSSPRPGDLVFFRYTYNAPDPDGVTHCGIYVGDGMMIHCGDPISYANLNSSYWQSHFYAYVYYACSTYKNRSRTACTMHSIKHNRLEAAVLFAIQQQVHLAVSYSEIIALINTAPVKKCQSKRLDDLIAAKERELAKVTRYKQGLYQDWKDGEITREDYHNMKADYERQTAMLTAVLENLTAERAELANGVDNEHPALVAFMKYQNIDKLTRDILVELVDHIKVYENGNISVRFKFADELRKIVEYIELNTEATTALSV